MNFTSQVLKVSGFTTLLLLPGFRSDTRVTEGMFIIGSEGESL